ncbi:DUF488 domain-containing protein [Streptomyces sp. NPDC056683]|uniref:DUF488 domain-containing protein n=1 Tax=Streptomyces sp. NPDC056683 TaxID=3345910 RepID=UPI0036B3AF9F
MLVDRLWPRGTREEPAHPDQWLRDVTPSADLRHWHHHDQERFAEFGIATSANWRTPITARPCSTCVISPPTTRSLAHRHQGRRPQRGPRKAPGRPPYSPGGSAPPAQRAAGSVLRHPADLAD